MTVDRLLGPALERARAHVALNGFEGRAETEFLDADVNALLREFIDQGRTFDAIVLDPPKFAPTVAHAERAARAYKDINRLALKLLEPGGVLFTFSCSGGISADLFHKIVASAGSMPAWTATSPNGWARARPSDDARVSRRRVLEGPDGGAKWPA
jgi:23S rRNA G2069 N7-methylase RlmK/C1962 C5-methylase RlmI